MKSRIEVDPNDPSGKAFVGWNDYGDDIKNLTFALRDVLYQIQDQPKATPAACDKNLRFIDTAFYANAVNTYAHYISRFIEVTVNPNSPSGKALVGRNDYGDDVLNLVAALRDVLYQIQGQPEDTPATFDKNLRFIDTAFYANAVNTYQHYLPRLLSMDDRSPNARLISVDSS
ncbi:hypothetical protein [Methylobacter marinus]|uniref:hypothetical protein n=1 Tax=Methylobacter marinus TaxID=34058 RepID=UPI00038007EC|nr:hypothetical protein [Methylobacter marinus]